MRPGKFIVSWDGLLPIVGMYFDGDLDVPFELNLWMYGEPEEHDTTRAVPELKAET